ncbi:hypothetical protein KEM56_000733 [Ascosphaera pollenicola]|nr:hypothetical protein KEM56_000733 [Ascosphaera pollenicola]
MASPQSQMQDWFAYLDNSATRVLPPLQPTNNKAGSSLPQPANASEGDRFLWTCKLLHVLVSQGKLNNDAIVRATKWYSRFSIYVDTAGLIPTLPGVDEVELDSRSSTPEEAGSSQALKAKRSLQHVEQDEQLDEEMERAFKRLKISKKSKLKSGDLRDADQGPEIVGTPEEM